MSSLFEKPPQHIHLDLAGTSIDLMLVGQPNTFWFLVALLLAVIAVGAWAGIVRYWQYRNTHYRAYIGKSKAAHKKSLAGKDAAIAGLKKQVDGVKSRLGVAQESLSRAHADYRKQQVSLALMQEQVRHALSDMNAAKAREGTLKQERDRLLAVTAKPVVSVADNTSVRELTAQLKQAQTELETLKSRFMLVTEWQNPKAHPLNIALGHDVHGNLIECGVDASYLVAGAKGWGKSNFMNSAILQWITRNDPKTLRMVMIDLKNGAELSFYEHIPHLAAPVAMTLEDALEQLTWLEAEGSRRQDFLRGQGKKKLDDYVESGKPLPFPFIMLVVDEVALMTRSKMVSDDDNAMITQCLSKLYNIVTLRRSAGILPLVATQSPDAQIIDTALRNNLDVRVCFRVVDATASRVILGAGGNADTLNRKGEAIVSANGFQVRLQTPKVENATVAHTVKAAIDKYGKADYTIWNKFHADNLLEIEDKPLNSFGVESETRNTRRYGAITH